MTTPADDKSGKGIRITMDKKAAIIEVIEGGVTKDRDRINPDLKSKRSSVAKAVGVDDATLLGWIETTKQDALQGNTTPHLFTVPKPENKMGDLIIRKMDEPDSAGVKHPLDPVRVMFDLLPTVSNELLMKWSDPTAICCLDIDYHDRPPPHESWLRARVTADLAPRPFAWNFSKRGGLHLFYIKSDPFHADELAAVAALAWRRFDPTGAVELKTGVRGPGDKPVFYSPGEVQDTTQLLRGWVDRTPADEQAAVEWRDAEGLEMGRRYDHTKCPINPTPGYASTGDPVVVMETGVFCHRCQGEGRALGCRRLGFAPYSAIIGGETAGELGAMLRTVCHWGHAKYILTRKYGMQELLAKKAYAAALKAFHHGSKKAALIPMAFLEQTEELTRLGQDWYNLVDFEPFSQNRIETILAKLPRVHVFDADDVPKPDPADVTLLMQSHNLESKGFPPINPIHGFSLSKTHLIDVGEPALYEAFPSSLRKDGGRYLPDYVPASRRKVEEAWKVIEEIAPGLDRKLVSLIICAIGTAQETQLGMHPKLFIEGAAGAAKSTTPLIAAAILGCRTGEVVHRGDENRWGHQMHAAVKQSGLVMFNEIIKDTERAAKGRPISIREPFDPLLNVTPDASVNVMYRGSRQYGRLPAFVLTEPMLPLTLRDERQIARRLWHWKVRGLKAWNESFERAGLKDVYMLRTLSTVVSGACNAIMSDIIDNFFATPMSWEKIAAAHGCQNIATSDEFEDLVPYLRDLFRLVCAAPKIENARLRSRYPNGYKKITRTSETVPDGNEDPLYAAYSMFADGRGNDWLQSRRLTEKEWSDILKVGEPVTIDLTNDGSSVFIRFRTGRANAPAKVNEQIIDPSNWEAKS